VKKLKRNKEEVTKSLFLFAKTRYWWVGVRIVMLSRLLFNNLFPMANCWYWCNLPCRNPRNLLRRKNLKRMRVNLKRRRRRRKNLCRNDVCAVCKLRVVFKTTCRPQNMYM
jgi:hypothetical protein